MLGGHEATCKSIRFVALKSGILWKSFMVEVSETFTRKRRCDRKCGNVQGKVDRIHYCPVFTEETLELAAFVKMFVTGADDPLVNRYCSYCNL